MDTPGWGGQSLYSSCVRERLHRWLATSWGARLAVAAGLLIVFGPVIGYDGMSADAAGFFWAREDPGPFLKVAGDGRPLNALLLWWAMSWPDTAEGLWLLRAAFLIQLVLLGWGLLAFVAPRRGRVAGVAVALLLLAGPGMIARCFAQSYCTPLAWAGALLAAACFRRSVAATAPGARWGWGLCGSVALVGAWSVYQPLGMTLVGLFVFELTTSEDRDGGGLRRWVATYAGFGGAAVIAYVVVVMRWLRGWLEAPDVQRAALSVEPVKKLVWFFAMPLRDALGLFVVTPSDPVRDAGLFDADVLGQGDLVARGFGALLHPAYACALLGGLALLWSWRHHVRNWPRHRAVVLALLAGALPAAYALNLVVASFWSPYRTQVPLYTVVVLTLWGAAWSAPGVRRWVAVWVGATLLGGLWLGVGMIRLPAEREWADATEQLRALAPDTRRVRLRPAAETAYYGWGMRYELGRPATAAPWGQIPYVQVAWHALGRAPLDGVEVVDDAAGADVVLGRRE